MEIWTTLPAVLLLALACNLDTVLLAVGYAAKGVRITFFHSLIIAAVTTAVTWPSLLLGDMAARILPRGLAGVLGGAALVGVGLWFVLDYLRRMGQGPDRTPAPAARSAWGWVSLAAALAVNNAGVGVAAGATGISPAWAAAGNFAVTLAALPLGRWLGSRLAGRLLGRYALLLTGALLLLLGAWEALA